MGGTQRVAKFVKYLPSYGWQPVVVTVKDVAYYAKDPTLLHDVAASEIYRTGSLDPQRILAALSPVRSKSKDADSSAGQLWGFLRRLAAWLCIPDSKVLWLPFAALKALRIIRAGGIECIFTTAPPHSVHLAGLFLKKTTGRPWIADFRDGWSGGNFQFEPTPFHKWLNRLLERRVLRHADTVLSVSEGLTEKLRQQNEIHPEKCATITNGYDAEDVDKVPLAYEEKFTITFCGAVTALTPLTGFFKALSSVFQTHPSLRDEITVKLVGKNLTGKLCEEIRHYALENVVTCTGYVSHRQALENVLNADLLLYPIAPGVSCDFVPGKTFEYLVSGKKIMAIGPCVEGVKILKAITTIELFAHENITEIGNSICNSYSNMKKQRRNDKKRIMNTQFERKELTRKLVHIFDTFNVAIQE